MKINIQRTTKESDPAMQIWIKRGMQEEAKMKLKYVVVKEGLPQFKITYKLWLTYFSIILHTNILII